MILIRTAIESDIDALCSFDQLAQRENERWEFIRREVMAGNCYAAVRDEQVIGYGVLHYTFYSFGFIELLYIDPNYRRSGAGRALLEHLEAVCRTPKIFTSTNLSNLPMQALLVKMNYVLSGVIHNLEEGDPEIVYFKRLSGSAGK